MGKYMTVIKHVCEVTLTAHANYGYWLDYLQQEGLTAHNADGHASIMVSAVSARYMGIKFRELSFSVAINDGADYFLVHAFNSIAPFAFAERAIFQTPYYHAQLVVKQHHIAMIQEQQTLFSATLAPHATEISHGFSAWEGTIHLPQHLRKQPQQPHYFQARLEGDTEIFAPQLVEFAMQPLTTLLQMLCESQFTIQEWRVRTDAQHSKSKTYHGE